MKNSNLMRSKFTPIYTFFGLLFLLLLNLSYSSGVANNTANEYVAGHPQDNGSMKTCANCHGGGAGIGSVSLEGVPEQIVAGQTYNMTLKLMNDQQMAGGFQLLASDSDTDRSNFGQFIVVDNETRVNTNGNQRLTHSGRKDIVNGEVEWSISWQAPQDLTTENVTFYFAGNAVNRNFSTSGDIVYNDKVIVPTGSGLAVDFLNFTTQNTTEGIRLNWSVANENQTAYYSIERSKNGKKFTPIATQIADNLTNQYQFTDTDLIKNNTYYYRIQEVATDGKTTFSPIETLTYRTLTAAVTAYPNPATTNATVQVKLPTNFAGTLQLVNVQGQVIYTQQVTTQLAELTLPTTNLAAGIYQLILQDGSEVFQQKLVIR